MEIFLFDRIKFDFCPLFPKIKEFGEGVNTDISSSNRET